jgi:hypothetical protein
VAEEDHLSQQIKPLDLQGQEGALHVDLLPVVYLV